MMGKPKDSHIKRFTSWGARKLFSVIIQYYTFLYLVSPESLYMPSGCDIDCDNDDDEDDQLPIYPIHAVAIHSQFRRRHAQRYNGPDFLKNDAYIVRVLHGYHFWLEEKRIFATNPWSLSTMTHGWSSVVDGTDELLYSAVRTDLDTTGIPSPGEPFNPIDSVMLINAVKIQHDSLPTIHYLGLDPTLHIGSDIILPLNPHQNGNGPIDVDLTNPKVLSVGLNYQHLDIASVYKHLFTHSLSSSSTTTPTTTTTTTTATTTNINNNTNSGLTLQKPNVPKIEPPFCGVERDINYLEAYISPDCGPGHREAGVFEMSPSGQSELEQLSVDALRWGNEARMFNDAISFSEVDNSLMLGGLLTPTPMVHAPNTKIYQDSAPQLNRMIEDELFGPGSETIAVNGKARFGPINPTPTTTTTTTTLPIPRLSSSPSLINPDPAPLVGLKSILYFFFTLRFESNAKQPKSVGTFICAGTEVFADYGSNYWDKTR